MSLNLILPSPRFVIFKAKQNTKKVEKSNMNEITMEDRLV